MRIPEYWSRVTRDIPPKRLENDAQRAIWPNGLKLDVWGWSDTSHGDARSNAAARVGAVVRSLSREAGVLSDDQDGVAIGAGYYPFAMREEVLERITVDGCEAAAVTRNRYFAEVLNTRDLMFVDIDLPQPSPRRPTLWERIAGRSATAVVEAEAAADATREAAIERIHAFTRADDRRGFRVYRTFAGLRLIATDGPYAPRSEETQKILDALGSDWLYQRLVTAQDCFRARLTPKHWRMANADRKRLPHYPLMRFRTTPDMVETWSDDLDARLKSFDAWLAAYNRVHTSYATCHYLEAFGRDAIDDDLRALVDRHDTATGAMSRRPLA